MLLRGVATNFAAVGAVVTPVITEPHTGLRLAEQAKARAPAIFFRSGANGANVGHSKSNARSVYLPSLATITQPMPRHKRPDYIPPFHRAAQQTASQRGGNFLDSNSNKLLALLSLL